MTIGGSSSRAELCKVLAGISLQRLFSNFAGSWAGVGMLLQRGLASSLLLHNVYIRMSEGSFGLSLFSALMGAVAGVFLLVGLWTPVAGAAAFVTSLLLLLTGTRESAPAVIGGILGGTIALVGPGAWSVDARIFGRKHIEPRHPQK